MKRLALAAILLAGTAFSTVQAAEMTFPSDAPVATIDIPEGWNAKEIDTGMEVMSPGESIYMSVEVAEPKDTDAVFKDAVDYLAGQGVTVDAASAKQEEGEINGMKSANVTWSGTDKDGPVEITLAAIATKAHVLVVTYWGTKGEQEQYAQQLGAMINSLKSAD